MDDELTILLIRTHRESGVLLDVSSLPDFEVFSNILSLKEVYFSCLIDGEISNLYEIISQKCIDKSIQNHLNTLKY